MLLVLTVYVAGPTCGWLASWHAFLLVLGSLPALVLCTHSVCCLAHGASNASSARGGRCTLWDSLFFQLAAWALVSCPSSYIMHCMRMRAFIH